MRQRHWPTYIYKLFQVLVQIGKILLASCVFSNQLLLPFEQILAMRLQLFALASLVLDSRMHELILVFGRTLREQSEEFLCRNQRQLLVFMATQSVS